MAKLKLKLDDYEYIEGTPEELATFMKIVTKQFSTEEVIGLKNIEDKNSISLLEDKLKDIEIISLLPKEEDMINFIISKERFEHNTIELQEKFLGKRIHVRDDPSYYAAFDNIMRKARKHIADKHNIVWDNRERKSYGKRTHVTVYKVKKQNEKHIPVVIPTSEKTTQSMEPFV